MTGCKGVNMSRFFVNPENIAGSSIFITDKNDIKHINKVLRLDIGDQLNVSDSMEFEYKTEIISIHSDEIEVKILDKQKFAREPELKVTLFQGVPKQGKMELIIQKTVELGVHAVVPVFTARTVVQDKGNFSKKIQRWQRISDEAVKQCKRGIVPAVEPSMTFKEMVEELAGFQLVLFPYENEEKETIKDCLRNLTMKVDNVAVIIGPEGGFSDEEADLLVGAGAKSVTLGKTILRTETAGLAAIAMIMYELEL
jgi:16S rRNA (uracil1498-N3)-methyltransferase